MGDAPGPAGTDPQNQENVRDGTMPVHAGLRPGLRGVHPHRRHPVEHPPKYASLNMAGILSYRPNEENVAEWHTVARKKRETFWSVAAEHQVPVERIIEFNFPGSVANGRVNPAIVNWYLHYHDGFHCHEADDHVNRKFKGGEKVAIPYMGHVDIGEVVLLPSPDEDPVLPVARYSPAPGLFVDRVGRAVSIVGAMEMSGPEATADRAASVQKWINKTWTHTFKDGYSVKCSVTVTFRPEGTKAGNATQIEADKYSHPSQADRGYPHVMYLNASETDGPFEWTAAHEFGHIIGLDDRYVESIVSRVMGQFGGKRTAHAEAGYEGNLMADVGGATEGKNVRDIGRENEPSAYWFNDDEQVRDWVNEHAKTEIGRLSTAAKVKMIHTLMGGRISAEDVQAIVRICETVTTEKESHTIRGAVNLMSFTDLGQRTEVEVAFSKMPR